MFAFLLTDYGNEPNEIAVWCSQICFCGTKTPKKLRFLRVWLCEARPVGRFGTLSQALTPTLCWCILRQCCAIELHLRFRPERRPGFRGSLPYLDQTRANASPLDADQSAFCLWKPDLRFDAELRPGMIPGPGLLSSLFEIRWNIVSGCRGESNPGLNDD